MSTSADQVARLLVLIPYVQARPGITVTEAADAFGVTARQLLADLTVALFCGLPGGMPGDLIEVDLDAMEGDGVIRLDNADVLAKPLRLVPDEAAALLLALRAIREVADPASYPVIDSTMAKLRGLAGVADAPGVFTVAAGTADVRQILTSAAARGQRLRLTYDGLVRGATSYPVVDPVAVEVREGVAYLEGWSLERGDWRSYRLDRIAAAELTGERAGDHGARPVRRDWLRGRGIHEVTVWLAPTARWVAESYGATDIRDVGDGYEVALRVADPAWLRQLVLRLGDQARILRPIEAEAGAVHTAREALAAYERWQALPRPDAGG